MTKTKKSDVFDKGKLDEEGVRNRKEGGEQGEMSESKEKTKIGDYHECPSYVQASNHLKTGYRIGFNRTSQILLRYYLKDMNQGNLNGERECVSIHFGVFLYPAWLLWVSLSSIHSCCSSFAVFLAFLSYLASSLFSIQFGIDSFSIFKMHNETLNIWTHLIGALIFIGIIVYVALSFAGASMDHVKEAFVHRVDPQLLMHSIKEQIHETVHSLETLK